MTTSSFPKSTKPPIIDDAEVPQRESHDFSAEISRGENTLNAHENTKDESEIDAESSPSSELNEDDSKYPGILKLSLIVFSLTLSLFCVGLDNTILSTAVPKITDEFDSLDDVGWYASSYLLTNCAFILTWGKLFAFCSVKWTYLIALSIFELGSLIAGVAPNSTALIIGRAISGIGGGGVGSGAFLLVAHSAPKRQRPLLVGIIGGVYGFASIAGPLMGGAFTDNPKLTWRWCFYINLPLGVVTAAFIVLCVHSTNVKRTDTIIDRLKQLDFPGIFCLMPGVVCLLLALQWGGTKYEWKEGRIIALLILAGVFSTAFVMIQIFSGERATVPPRVFSNRNIWGSAVFGSCVTGCFFVMLYYIPIWFQAIKGASAITSGIMNLPMVLSFAIFSLLSGSLTSITGQYVPLMHLSIIFLSVGCGLLTTLDVDSSPAKWIGYQVIFGAGVGSGLQTALTSPQTALQLQDIAIGTSVIMFCENLVAAIMVSVAQNIFTNQLVSNFASTIPGIDLSAVLKAGALQIKNQVPEEYLDAVIIAYNKSLTHTFYVGVALACCSLLGAVWLEWLSVKPKKIDTKSDA